VTPARILLDEMITPVVATGLRRHGHDATAVTDQPGLAGSSDERILELATAEERILVTLNIADFRILDATWKSTGRTHHGIVCVSTKAFPQSRNFTGALIAALHHAATTGALPAPDETTFLHPAPTT
jgi:hypothetical protein